MQARKGWYEIFKELKIKNHQPIILYPKKLFFKYEGEIKPFSNKKLREFIASRIALQEMLKEVLQVEGK